MTERMFPLMQPQIEVARSLLLKPNISFSGLKAASSRYHGGEMELRIDGRDGEVIGTLRIPYTGEWENWGEFATDVKSVTGVHDLYFVCKGKKPHELFNFDYWCFK